MKCGLYEKPGLEQLVGKTFLLYIVGESLDCCWKLSENFYGTSKKVTTQFLENFWRIIGKLSVIFSNKCEKIILCFSPGKQ